MARRKKPNKCEVCGREPGSLLTREIDACEIERVPLGPLERCRECGLWACPDCYLEVDCCVHVAMMGEMGADAYGHDLPGPGLFAEES